MADLLLTHGYILEDDEKERAIMRPYPPLGLQYVSAFLKREGLDVDLFDPTLSSSVEMEERLATGPSTVAGFYSTLMTRGEVVRWVERARDHGWIVVVGGPDAGNYPREYLEHGAHVVVNGEGELTLLELLPRLAEHGPHRLHGVAGASFRDESNEVVSNPARQQIANLDQLPWPDRGSIDIPAYMKIWRDHHGSSSVNLITARGCAYRCNWCSHSVFGHTHRRRSWLDCANEVEWIDQTYRPDQLWYSDDVFTISHPWLEKFAAELKGRGIRLPFETISRADRMMNEEAVRTLADMGCYRIWIGAESGSQRILDAMQRGVKKEQVRYAVKTAQKFGIEVGMFLMWGYEGETFADVEQTVEFVSEVRPDIFFTTLAYPIMNTGYYEKVRARVIVPKPWAQTSDRETEIRGRPGREHFRPADQWLKAAVKAAGTDADDATTAAALREQEAEARERFLASCRELGY